jgi:hypothetical protein
VLEVVTAVTRARPLPHHLVVGARGDPRRPVAPRTIGKTYTAPGGKTFRPSMFITLTCDSYGKVGADGTPALDLGALWAMLTSRDQGFYSRPARVSPYGWHEWGMYISAAGVAVLVLGVVFVQGKREAALKGVGLLFVVLGFGAFHALDTGQDRKPDVLERFGDHAREACRPGVLISRRS